MKSSETKRGRSQLRPPPSIGGSVGDARLPANAKSSFFGCLVTESQLSKKSIVQTNLLGNNCFCLKPNCPGVVHVVEMDRMITSPCIDYPLYSIEKRRIVKCNRCFYMSTLQAHKMNSQGRNNGVPFLRLETKQDETSTMRAIKQYPGQSFVVANESGLEAIATASVAYNNASKTNQNNVNMSPSRVSTLTGTSDNGSQSSNLIQRILSQSHPEENQESRQDIQEEQQHNEQHHHAKQELQNTENHSQEEKSDYEDEDDDDERASFMLTKMLKETELEIERERAEQAKKDLKQQEQRLEGIVKERAEEAKLQAMFQQVVAGEKERSQRREQPQQAIQKISRTRERPSQSHEAKQCSMSRSQERVRDATITDKKLDDKSTDTGGIESVDTESEDDLGLLVRLMNRIKSLGSNVGDTTNIDSKEVKLGQEKKSLLTQLESCGINVSKFNFDQVDDNLLENKLTDTISNRSRPPEWLICSPKEEEGSSADVSALIGVKDHHEHNALRLKRKAAKKAAARHQSKGRSKSPPGSRGVNPLSSEEGHAELPRGAADPPDPFSPDANSNTHRHKALLQSPSKLTFADLYHDEAFEKPQTSDLIDYIARASHRGSGETTSRDDSKTRDPPRRSHLREASTVELSPRHHRYHHDPPLSAMQSPVGERPPREPRGTRGRNSDPGGKKSSNHSVSSRLTNPSRRSFPNHVREMSHKSRRTREDAPVQRSIASPLTAFQSNKSITSFSDDINYSSYASQTTSAASKSPRLAGSISSTSAYIHDDNRDDNESKLDITPDYRYRSPVISPMSLGMDSFSPPNPHNQRRHEKTREVLWAERQNSMARRGQVRGHHRQRQHLDYDKRRLGRPFLHQSEVEVPSSVRVKTESAAAPIMSLPAVDGPTNYNMGVVGLPRADQYDKNLEEIINESINVLKQTINTAHNVPNTPDIRPKTPITKRVRSPAEVRRQKHTTI